MQTEVIDTFLDLIETRSFHRTAERLQVKQSTISAQGCSHDRARAQI